MTSQSLIALTDLPMQQKTILVMDLVESVRLIAHSEKSVVREWRKFVKYAGGEVIPRHHGRLVKSLGDGILAQFDDARQAVRAAVELHRYFDAVNASHPAQTRYLLRAGIHCAGIFVDDIDVYGAGVNLAARVAGLAAPGETVVTAEAKAYLCDDIDGDFFDKGYCHLKHLEEPVRVWSVGAPHAAAPYVAPPQEQALFPKIAVLTLECLVADPQQAPIGSLISDRLSVQFGKQPLLRAISRSSLKQLRFSRNYSDLRTHLQAQYTVSGSFSVYERKVMMCVELVELETQNVLLVRDASVDMGALFEVECEALVDLAHACMQRITQQCADVASLIPPPNIESYKLLTAGSSFLHRNSVREFALSRDLLTELCKRHPYVQYGWAELANWCVLGVVQGWHANSPALLTQALEYSDRARNLDSAASRPVAMHGLVLAYLKHDLDAAKTEYETALALNRSDAWANLLLGATLAFRGDGEQAVQYCEAALSLVPLHPMRYFFESLAATAYLSAGDYSAAMRLAQHSLKKNTLHTSTLRALAISSELSGHETQARSAVKKLLTIDPGYTVSAFRNRYPGSQAGHADLYAQALRSAGLPS